MMVEGGFGLRSACSPMRKLMSLMLGCQWDLIQRLVSKARAGLPW